MNLQKIKLEIEDFNRFDWQKIINQNAIQIYSSYADDLKKAMRVALEKGDEKSAHVCSFLGDVASMHLVPDSIDQPFVSFLSSPTGRRANLTDISGEDLHLIRELVPTMTEADFKARLADIVWTLEKDPKMAEQAVCAYLESAAYQIERNWAYSILMFHRAIVIANLLGRTSKAFTTASTKIVNTIVQLSPNDETFFTAKLLDLAIRFKLEKPEKIVEISERSAEATRQKANWDLYRELKRISTRMYQSLKDGESESRTVNEIASSFLDQAKRLEAEQKPNYSQICLFLQQAIAEFRRVAGSKETVQEIHRMLLKYQEYTAQDLITASSELDISDIVRQSVEQAKGKTLPEALLNLALIDKSEDVSNLRQDVIESIREFPLQHLFQVVEIDDSGRTVATRPSLFSESQTGHEEEITKEMYRHALFYKSLTATARINPFREQIIREHTMSVENLLPVVTSNPIVPPGRELIFALGLKEGFYGNFLVSSHLLVPQLEHAIRYTLNQYGIITTKYDQKGIQDEKDLNALFYDYHDKLNEIFGENLVFDLQGLLIERFGDNLRNRLSHGLLDADEFWTSKQIYLWWLTLRLCLLPRVACGLGNDELKKSPPDQEVRDCFFQSALKRLRRVLGMEE